MKQVHSMVASWSKRLMFVCISLFATIVSFAQDKKIDVDINTGKSGGGGFFASPIVWVVGIAVFILLLVALLRNNNGSRADV